MSRDFFKAVDSKMEIPSAVVLSITDLIVAQIQKLPEKDFGWTVTITTIIEKLDGEVNEDNYALYLHALDQAAKQFNVQWKHAGRNGRTYFMSPTDLASYISLRQQQQVDIAVMQTICITCPHCNTPTNYEIQFKPKSN